jgi:hypothetical protein
VHKQIARFIPCSPACASRGTFAHRAESQANEDARATPPGAQHALRGRRAGVYGREATGEGEEGSGEEEGEMSLKKFTREDLANCLCGVAIGIIIQRRLLAHSPDWIAEASPTVLIVVGLILLRPWKRE